MNVYARYSNKLDASKIRKTFPATDPNVSFQSERFPDFSTTMTYEQFI